MQSGLLLLDTLPDCLDNALNRGRTSSFLLGGVEGKPLNLLVFDLLDDPVLNPSVFCADFQFLQIVQVVEVIPDTMLLVFMLFKELSSFLYCDGSLSAVCSSKSPIDL